MKYTRRAIIVPDADLGKDSVKSIKTVNTGGSNRTAAKVDEEASPVTQKPERGSRFRQYQREQDGDVYVWVDTNPAPGTAVSEPVKKFKDDIMKASDRRYLSPTTSTASLKDISASGDGDIMPVLSGTPESETKINLLVSATGAGDSPRFTFNIAEEDRVTYDSSSDAHTVKKMPGDVQFRGSPTIFHKAPDVLISSDGGARPSSDLPYLESPSITPPQIAGAADLHRGSKYYCRPKLLPLEDGRLMSVYLESNMPVQHWCLSGLDAAASGNTPPVLSNAVMVQYASDETGVWGTSQELDPTGTLLFPASDPSTKGEPGTAVFFADVCQYKDTDEILLVAATNAVGHLGVNLFGGEDYVTATASDDQPNATVNVDDFAGGAYASEKYLFVLSSQDNGETWSRRSMLSLKTVIDPVAYTTSPCDVPGIDETDMGLVLGGACEIMDTGRLVVTLCTGENVYLLNSDDRGNTFRANKVKEIAVEPKITQVAAYQNTPPPNGEAIVGQVYIPKRYDHVVSAFLTGAELEDQSPPAAGTYIVTSEEPPDTVEGNPLKDIVNCIFDLSYDPNTNEPIISNVKSPSDGATAWMTGGFIPNKTFTASSLIFDTQSNDWLTWDARGAWDGVLNEEPVVYRGAEVLNFPGGPREVDRIRLGRIDNPNVTRRTYRGENVGLEAQLVGPSTGSNFTRVNYGEVQEYTEAFDCFGSFARVGFILDVVGGDEFSGSTLVRSHSSYTDNPGESLWSVSNIGSLKRSAKARDTMMSAGMCLSEDGAIVSSVSYTDFTSLSNTPEYISASFMEQFLGKHLYDRPNSETLVSTAGSTADPRLIKDQDVLRTFFTNPSIYFADRVTSVFTSYDGESVIESKAWSYRDTSENPDAASNPPSSSTVASYESIKANTSGAYDECEFGPSCYESSVTIRPDGIPQIYSATHNWMPPSFLGAHNDLYVDETTVPYVNSLFDSRDYVRNPGVMNVIATKAATSAPSTGSADLFDSDFVTATNSSQGAFVVNSADRDTLYDIGSNEISLCKNGTDFGERVVSLDPRRASGCLPCHGTTSYYVPSGLVHPGALGMTTKDGVFYMLPFVWGLNPVVLSGDDLKTVSSQGNNIRIGISPNKKDTLTGLGFVFAGNVVGDWSFYKTAEGIKAFRDRYGYDFQPGTKFYGEKKIQAPGVPVVLTYRSGPRTDERSYDASVFVDIDQPNPDFVFSYDDNALITAKKIANTVRFEYSELQQSDIRVLQNLNASTYDSSLSRYFCGLSGGVTGIDSVQWRGQTVIISCHTHQYNQRNSTQSGSTSQRTRSLINNQVVNKNDNSSIVVYRSSSWQPIRENLGRVDNSWDIGMGSMWPDSRSLFGGTPFQFLSIGNRTATNTTSNSKDVSLGVAGDGMNARNRFFRMMTGRWYQSTFDGQRDPARAGWNVESSTPANQDNADSQIYLIDSSMPSTIGTLGTGVAPLPGVAASGGGCVIWRGEGGGSVIYLGGSENKLDNKNKMFLPFSEGRGCSPIADGLKKSSNGSALTGGFRIVFSPFSQESYTPNTFKVFFSLLLNNKKWLPSSDVDNLGQPPTAKQAGIIISLGYDSTLRKLTLQAYDGGRLFSDIAAPSNVQAIGKPVQYDLPSAEGDVKWFEILAGFEEAFTPTPLDAASSTPAYGSLYPRPISFHAFSRPWSRDSDPDWTKSYEPLVNFHNIDTYDVGTSTPYNGPLGNQTEVLFNEEHFLIGNMGYGIGGTHTNTSEGGVVIKSASLHRPGTQIKGGFDTALNVPYYDSAGAINKIGGGIYDIRAFGTSQSLPNTELVKGSNDASGVYLSGDVFSEWGPIDPRLTFVDTESSDFYYSQPMFWSGLKQSQLSENDAGLFNPTKTQICRPRPTWVYRGILAEWRGSAQDSASFAVTSSHLFSASNMLEGPVSKSWKTADGVKVSTIPVQRNQNWSELGSNIMRTANEKAYTIENVEIVFDAWGSSGDAASGSYINDVYNKIATSRQFSATGIAMFGKNFPAFELSFYNDDTDPADVFTRTFGLPGDGRIVKDTDNWVYHEPDRYAHLWAWTLEQWTPAGYTEPQSPIVMGGEKNFPYFGDFTFTYQKRLDRIDNLTQRYSRVDSEDKVTPWMPSQFKSSKNGPSYYIQVISEAHAGKSDEACRFIFKIRDNTEDTLFLEENPLRYLSQYSYKKGGSGNGVTPIGTDYRSWKVVSIFSDRMASEIVTTMIDDESKRAGDDGFYSPQSPSSPGTGFRYMKLTIKGCTRFGSERGHRLGRFIMGRMMDLSGPDFEWGWSRSEESGVSVRTSKGGQRFAKQNHSPKRKFNVSHHPLRPAKELFSETGRESNYFESPRRGFGSQFGPGYKQENRTWQEVVHLLRSLGPGIEQAALVWEGDSALESKAPGGDTLSRTGVPVDPTDLCLVRLIAYGQMSHVGYNGVETRVPVGSQQDATTGLDSFGATVCRPRPIIEVTSLEFEEEF